MFWNKNILGPLCMLLWQVYELPIILANNNNKFQDSFSWLQKTKKEGFVSENIGDTSES